MEDLPIVMTTYEVDEFHWIPRSSVYSIAQERRIPRYKVGRRWHFHRKVIGAWLCNQVYENIGQLSRAKESSGHDVQSPSGK